MIHDLSEYSLAGVHPSLSAIGTDGGCGVSRPILLEKVQIEKTELLPSPLIQRLLSTGEKL
jgi:hypothetical protein